MEHFGIYSLHVMITSIVIQHTDLRELVEIKGMLLVIIDILIIPPLGSRNRKSAQRSLNSRALKGILAVA